MAGLLLCTVSCLWAEQAPNALSIRLESTSLLARTPQGERQMVLACLESAGVQDAVIRLVRPDLPQPLEVRFSNVASGRQVLPMLLPPATGELLLQGSFVAAGGVQAEVAAVPMRPPRRWTLYLVQHTHTDIGYTRPQTEILPEHLRYIDHALDLCDLTDSYPEEARFRWTCETSWAVREYLRRRPAGQIGRLRKRVAEGRIELTAMLLNMSEIADEGVLAASLQPLSEMRAVFGDTLRTAMQNDVNGAAWCLPDYFSTAGIRYLTMGINKTRSLLPFDTPTAFWWESPSGKRTLAFRPDHYMTGNRWKIHTGRVDEGELAQYLSRLEQAGYPFDRLAVQYSGYFTDNSPPAQTECQAVRDWNQAYAWPRLRLATAREFLEYVEKEQGANLPVHRQAWPDWWTDGFGSAARETAAVRETQAGLQVSKGLLAMAVMAGLPLPPGTLERVAAIQEALLFYDEHTFGAAESISDPLAENSMVQWGEKSSYAWEAVKTASLLREEALGLLQQLLPRSEAPTLAVFNTLGWIRSGVALAFIDHEFVPGDRACLLREIGSGREYAGQRLRSRSEGSYWAFFLQDVPPLGFRAYRVVAGDPGKKEDDGGGDAVLENRFYRLEVSPLTGAIRSALDKTSGRQLVDESAPWQLGQFIYERAVDRRDFETAQFPKDHPFRRSTLSDVKLGKVQAGPLWQSVVIQAEADGCVKPNGVHLEIRLFNDSRRIELHYTIRKMGVRDPEGVYVAFPVRASSSIIQYEAQGGAVIPGPQQLPGSSSDWQTIQTFAAVKDGEGQFILSSPQVPLVQLGDLNLGKWMPITRIEKPHIYSWVMNNYWFTNFLSSQEGEFRWSYSLTSSTDQEPSLTTRFGWESTIPLATRVLPPGAPAKLGRALPVWELGPAHLLLVEARPARQGGVILHLREVAGKTATLALGAPLTELNVLESPIGRTSSSLVFAPYEVKFVKVNPQP
jgi:hypothetical protein